MATNRVFAVAGAKGGVGKTTSSLNLAAVLSEAGYSTVAVELDLAMANVVDFVDVDIDIAADTTFHDALAGEVEDVDEIVYETAGGLSVVPSGVKLDGYAQTDLDRLPDVVDRLRGRYDVVFLDTPAGLSDELVAPIRLADETVLVSTPRVASVRNVGNTMELVDRVDGTVSGLLLTKSGTGASPGAHSIAEFLGIELLGHVPEDEAVPHSQDRGKPVVEYAPNSGAAIAYKRVAERLVGEEIDALTEADDPEEESEDRPDDPTVDRTDERTVSTGADGGGETTDTDPTADASDGAKPVAAASPGTAGVSVASGESVPDAETGEDAGGSDDADRRTENDGDEESTGPERRATAHLAPDLSENTDPADGGRGSHGTSGEESDGTGRSLGRRLRSLFGF